MQVVQVEGQSPVKDFSYEWVQGHQDLKFIEEAFPVTQFAEEIERRDLEMEFRLLRRLTETQHHSDNLIDITPDIQKFNRYNNILPYKHSIVTLGDEEDHQNYINADFISSVDGQTKNIIATQGPLQNTVNNFWKMIHAEKVNLIIMLCNLKENGKSQCEQYWPQEPDESIVCGGLTVRLDSTQEISPSLIHRHLKVSGEQKHHSLTQVHWQGWVDQGVPTYQDFDIILQIVDFIVSSLQQHQKVLFHCSAGIGRTGTLISLANMMLTLRIYMLQVGNDARLIEQNPEMFKMTIFGTVRRLREQRWGMVHTSDQYSYLYKFMDRVMSALCEKN